MNVSPIHEKPIGWHALAAEAVSAELCSDPITGLTEQEARKRLALYGPNELPEAHQVSPLRLFLAQFSSLMVWVLIGAAVISGLLADWVDTAAILAIVILNAILGFVQEFRAERSLAALKKMSVTSARVVREGTVRSIPSRDLVPGDLVLIEAGDHVPADARLVQVSALRTQEAALTGESTPVDKSTVVLTGDGEVAIADRHNMVFLGTYVAAGKGRAVVVATGLRTELGRIATLMTETRTEATPLQRRLEHLGQVLLYLSLGIVTIVFLLGVLRGEPLIGMFLTAVSLAVAAVPEGLPAIVTVTLALGVHRMVRRHALIRRLPAVETLGSTTVICTDKTGTLTKNEMTVTRLYCGGHTFDVTGEGYAPVGEIKQVHGPWSMVDGESEEVRVVALTELLTAAVLCNGAVLRETQDGWRILGDPTEGALLVVAAKWGVWKERVEASHPFVGEIPFDPERKMMSVVRRTPDGIVAYVKGAPDVLLRRCTRQWVADGRVEPLTDAMRQRILEVNVAFASEALRVLGIGKRPLSGEPDRYEPDELERDLIFLGLAAMKDPLRPEAVAAVRACQDAGIRIVMITGDHKDTAVAIARELGLLKHKAQAMTGTELDWLTDAELAQRVASIAVYARVSAEHKLRIVRAWKTQGAVVAMTGDGVNDAPAVKEADIGISMGQAGTDVTKEASDMVVTDDNFASIVAAVEEGRGLYANIQKAVHYLLSCNLSEVLVMLFATLFGLPLPLLPVQILWINLVTDGLPALALTVDPADPDLMRRPPRQPNASILSQRRLARMFAQGLFMAVITIGAFAYCLYGAHQDLVLARTIAFTVLVMGQLFFALSCRSDRYPLTKLGLLTNRPLLWAIGGSAALQAGILVYPAVRDVFKSAALTPEHWVLVVGLGMLPLLAMEGWKALMEKVSSFRRSPIA